jgi:hypothetical protein
MTKSKGLQIKHPRNSVVRLMKKLRVHAHSNNLSPAAISSQTGIPYATVYGWLQQRGKRPLVENMSVYNEGVVRMYLAEVEAKKKAEQQPTEQLPLIQYAESCVPEFSEGYEPGPQFEDLTELRAEIAKLKEQAEGWKAQALLYEGMWETLNDRQEGNAGEVESLRSKLREQDVLLAWYRKGGDV